MPPGCTCPGLPTKTRMLKFMDENKDGVLSLDEWMSYSLSGDRLAVKCCLLTFALLDYRVTNQIYLSLSRNTSSTKLGNQAVPNEAL